MFIAAGGETRRSNVCFSQSDSFSMDYIPGIKTHAIWLAIPRWNLVSGIWGGKEKHKWLWSLVFEPRDGWRLWLVFHRHRLLTSHTISFRTSEGPLSGTGCVYWMYFLSTSLSHVQLSSPLCQPFMEGANFILRLHAFLDDFPQYCIILPRVAHNRFKVCP